MKIRTLGELEELIYSDYSWRRKELTDFKLLAVSSRPHIKTILLKSGVALLYSHWEGFLKSTSISYCDYLNYLGLKYRDLKKNFHVCALIRKFDGQYPPKNFKSSYDLIMGNSFELNESLKIDSKKYIDTQSNLNSVVLREIAQKVGLDYSGFELKENLIDERFLGVRNAICHGEYRVVEEEDFNDLYDEITSLMELFKNNILNIANQKGYLSEE